MDRNGWAAILAAKWSAGVVPEVNLRILFHACDEAHKSKESTLALKPRADAMWLSGSTKRTNVLQNLKKERIEYSSNKMIDIDTVINDKGILHDKPEFYGHSFLTILIENFSLPTLFKNLYEKIMSTNGSQKVEGKESF